MAKRTYKILAVGSLSIVLVGGLLVLSRGGYVLPGLGSMLNLAVPPDGLYGPVSRRVPLVPGETTYRFEVVHRHPGEHAIRVRFSEELGELPNPDDIELRASLTLTKEGRVLLEARGLSPTKGGYQRIQFAGYDFPRDVSERDGVRAIVEIHGDIAAFTSEYDEGTVAISKVSDL